MKKHLDGTEKNFVDLFAGSNSVGNYFSSKYRIISNDIMYFSYVLARGTLGIKQSPSFSTLKDLGIDDPIKYFNSVDISKYHGDFVTREYSPSGKSKRMYFTFILSIIKFVFFDYSVRCKAFNYFTKLIL